MTSANCLLQKIFWELEKLNNRVSIRSNTVAIIEIDTANTKKRNYTVQKLFNTPNNIIGTQLTILEKGGGFYINVNNTGSTTASKDYEIENEEIRNIEIHGSGIAGTGKIRLGANI